MAIKKILRIADNSLSSADTELLKSKCCSVSNIDNHVKEIISDLRDTLHNDDLSVGLAAPQIGYNEAIAVINLGNDRNDDLILINPEILSESGQKDIMLESCMSIPHKRGKVERRKKVIISYLDTEGVIRERKASGFIARVIRHEIDHLNGILYSDRMNPEDRLEDTDLFRRHGIK